MTDNGGEVKRSEEREGERREEGGREKERREEGRYRSKLRIIYLAIGAQFAVALASYFASWIVTDTVSRELTAVYGIQ